MNSFIKPVISQSFQFYKEGPQKIPNKKQGDLTLLYFTLQKAIYRCVLTITDREKIKSGSCACDHLGCYA